MKRGEADTRPSTSKVQVVECGFRVDCQADCQGDTQGGFWALQKVHSGIGFMTDGALSCWQMSDERLRLSSLYVTLLVLSFTVLIPVFFLIYFLI